MKMDLSKGEFEVMYDTAENMLQKNTFDNTVYGQILKLLLTRLFVKLYGKYLLSKTRYKFNVDTEQALAFFELTKNNSLPYDSYEGNAINRINSIIHKETTSTKLLN